MSGLRDVLRHCALEAEARESRLYAEVDMLRTKLGLGSMDKAERSQLLVTPSKPRKQDSSRSTTPRFSRSKERRDTVDRSAFGVVATKWHNMFDKRPKVLFVSTTSTLQL
jgi:hypothetical protein